MPTASLPARLLLFVSFLVVLPCLTGCGTGTYNERMEQKLTQLNYESTYLRRLTAHPKEIYDDDGYGIRIRIPLIFEEALKTSHIGPFQGIRTDNKGKVVEPTRYAPPFLQQPGRWQAFEHLYSPSAGNNYTFYGYFAFVPEEEQSAEALKADILARLLAAYPGSDLAWESVQIPLADGGSAEWQKLTVMGEMGFDLRFLKSAYQPSDPLTDYPARMDLYLAPFEQPLKDDEEEGTRNFTAVIGWRAGTQVMGDVGFFPSTEAAMGTVDVAEEGEVHELPGSGDAESTEEEEEETPEAPVLQPRR